ncbi:MAG TPA: hypothetical protein VK034_31405 [Enhygromyxa sp.]|nr:hypothetical protein [Enhygromyxa sp.]
MTALTAGLIHGALLCAWMTFVILASLRQDPRIWQDDLPKSMKAELGPTPPQSRRRRSWWGLVAVVGLVGVSAHLMISGLPAATGIRERLLAAYVTFELFNLYDALVIDIGVILLWAPDWAFPPGIKGHPALRDWKFHVRAYLIGVVAGLPFAGVVVGIWAAFRVIY